MSMTHIDYLEHPMGKGSSMGSRIYKEVLIKEYNKYLVDKNRITFNTIKYKGRYFFIAKVESRTIKGFFYDVILEFTSINQSESLKIDGSYNMRVFSNAPSFNFTYAYTFNRMDMIIYELKSKFSKIALVGTPEVRNPSNVVNYDRILFFTILHMLRNKIYDTSMYKDDDLKNYISKIDTPEVIISKYEREKKIREVNDKRARDKENRSKESTKSKPVLSSHKKDESSKRDHVKAKVTGKAPKKPKGKR